MPAPPSSGANLQLCAPLMPKPQQQVHSSWVAVSSLSPAISIAACHRGCRWPRESRSRPRVIKAASCRRPRRGGSRQAGAAGPGEVRRSCKGLSFRGGDASSRRLLLAIEAPRTRRVPAPVRSAGRHRRAPRPPPRGARASPGRAGPPRRLRPAVSRARRPRPPPRAA